VLLLRRFGLRHLRRLRLLIFAQRQPIDSLLNFPDVFLTRFHIPPGQVVRSRLSRTRRRAPGPQLIAFPVYASDGMSFRALNLLKSRNINFADTHK
jgi:hypothetical protein